MSYYITVDSFLSTNNYTNNNAVDFRNTIPTVKLAGLWEIAVLYIDTSVKNRTFIKVNLDEIDQQEYGSCNMDKCVYIFQGEKAFPFQCKRPVYFPLEKSYLNTMHITLEDQDNKKLTCSPTDRTVIKFHLRIKRDNMKILHTSSLFDKSLFPQNNLLSYTNTISSLFHNYIDFSNWEIAVDSISIPTEIIKKDINIASIQTNIIQEQRCGPNFSSIIEHIPIKSNDTTYYLFKCNTLHFVPIRVTRLDSISVNILLNYTKVSTDVKDKNTYITFLLRKKTI